MNKNVTKWNRPNYLIALFIFITGCRPPVTFDRAQPPNAKELSTFPKRIQGEYLSQDKVSILTISDKLAIRTYDFDLKISKDSLGRFQLNGDTLTDKASGQKQIVVIAGDTIYAHSHGIDTLFYISGVNVLKKFRGYYFLNILYDKNAWTIRQLSLSGGILVLSDIADSTHIDQLREITETPADTICSNFKLNQDQFKKFVNGNGFDQAEQFTRLRGN